MDFFRNKNWDLVKYTWLWFTISGLLVVVGMVAWGLRGLNYGIDFTGGSLLRYRFEQPLATAPGQDIEVISQTRQMLEGMGLGKSQIQVSGVDGLYIRTPEVANDEEAAQRDEKVEAGLTELFGERSGAITKLGRETVGPVIGEMLTRSAIQALVLGVLLILVYITVRYEFRFAVAAVIALLHDTLVLVGAMAILQIELNTWFVAAILTVLGYSMNDTVVIFDRIRENRGIHRRAPIAAVVNASLLQTMTRSINTVGTTLFTLIALYILGGTTIEGFALALIIGIAGGCYSSIFNASPIVVLWYNWADRRKRALGTGQRRVTAAVTAARSGAPRAVLAAAEQEQDDQQEEARPTAQDTMRRAEQAAHEEKREARKERRKKQRDAAKRKRRF